MTKHVEPITTMKISRSDTLASKPTSSEPILPLCEAEFRHNPYPCHSFSQAPSHQIRCSFKVAVQRATTWHGTKYLRVAGTCKCEAPFHQPSTRQNMAWIPSSGLPVLTRSSHALRKNKSAKETDDFPHVALRISPFPLVCLKV